MSTLKQILLSPIRFYPALTFGSSTVFQNPDNRVSHGYNWDGVNSLPYALPIPKQWPDGQPGIDFLIDIVTADGTFYADLYDSDDAKLVSLNVSSWNVGSTETQYRVFYDGLTGSGITDGYYTIKLFATADDTLLLQSEPLIIAEWFDDMVPFEFTNFENDFGVIWNNGTVEYTARMLVPIKIYDPTPQFEKEIYKDDPGVLTTLRTTVQRVFNFDSLPVPVHIAEFFSMAFANSELYLNRMKVNSDAAPESDIIEGTNLKQITGQATLVNYNDTYQREKVETEFSDQGIEWNSYNYSSANISANTLNVTTVSCGSNANATSDSHSHAAGELILVKIILADTGSSALPTVVLFPIGSTTVRNLAWGVNYLSYRMVKASGFSVRLRNLLGERAFYDATITLSSVI